MGMWWKNFMWSLKTHVHASQKFLNSPIWRFNHELISTIANKGWIHRELGYFSRNIQILIKLDNELRWESRKISIFVKKTSRWIHRIKNYSITISIRGEIKKRHRERKWIAKREKILKITKIHLICWSKLKSNVIGWKIRRKTQNHARIKAFHSVFWKTKIQSSISEFFLDKILISNTHVTQKWV